MNNFVALLLQSSISCMFMFSPHVQAPNQIGLCHNYIRFGAWVLRLKPICCRPRTDPMVALLSRLKETPKALKSHRPSAEEGEHIIISGDKKFSR